MISAQRKIIILMILSITKYPICLLRKYLIKRANCSHKMIVTLMRSGTLGPGEQSCPCGVCGPPAACQSTHQVSHEWLGSWSSECNPEGGLVSGARESPINGLYPVQC